MNLTEIDQFQKIRQQSSLFVKVWPKPERPRHAGGAEMLTVNFWFLIAGAETLTSSF